MAPKKVRLPQYPARGPIPGPEMVRRAGLKDALANTPKGNGGGESGVGRFLDRLLNPGVSPHDFDPRTRNGIINMAAMFAGGGKGMSRGEMADAAIAQHLGHEGFKPYKLGTPPEAYSRYRFELEHPETRAKREERAQIYGRTEMDNHVERLHKGESPSGSDPVNFGGLNPHQMGADMGYPNFGSRMQDIHGYSLAELLGLVHSPRIAGPRTIAGLNKKSPGAGFLHMPYRTQRGLNN